MGRAMVDQSGEERVWVEPDRALIDHFGEEKWEKG